mmetsp:Transcript_28176/g.87316  ORF Transcript_28176/g.87316 Transcript_28176/m.87316 type:complete len:438 (+) Transcript_28176:517-1830(+)
MEPRDAAVGVLVHRALGALELTDHHLGQRGLAGTVGADEADARLGVHTQVQPAVQERAVGVVEPDVGELNHRRRQFTAGVEEEVDLCVGLDLLHEPSALHLVQHLHLRLRLPRALLVGVLEAADVILHVRDLGLLALVALHLVGFQRLAGAAEGVVVALVVLELVALHVDDVRAHLVHEILRVRHHEQDLVEGRQIGLQPDDRLDVQMVGGLVEQQQRRTLEEGLGKRNTHAPTTREGRSGAGLHGVREAETEENLGGAGPGRRGVKLFQPSVDLVHADFTFVAARDGLELLLEALVLRLAQSQHSLDGRHGVARSRLLLHVEVVEAFGEGNFAASEHAQKRSLAATVRSNETVAVAGEQLKLRVLQQLGAGEGNVQIFHNDFGNVTVLARRVVDGGAGLGDAFGRRGNGAVLGEGFRGCGDGRCALGLSTTRGHRD